MFSLTTYVLFMFWFSFVEQEVDGDQKPQPEQTTSLSSVTKGRFFPPFVCRIVFFYMAMVVKWNA